MKKVLFLLINSTCDIACTYCFYTTGYETRSRFRVLPSAAENVAERINAAGFTSVVISGGDPLHSRHKSETYALIEHIKARGQRVIVNTSAVKLCEKDIDIIIKLDIDRIDVSIDSHETNIHDAQRGCHSETVWAIRTFVEKGYVNLACTIVVTGQNAPTLSKTIRWLRAIGIEDVRIQRAFLPHGTDVKSDEIMRAMQMAVPLLHSPHASDYVELTRRAFESEEALPYARCRMGKEYFVCDAKGNLTPCFHRADISLGNLFNDPLDQLKQLLTDHELTSYEIPPCFGGHCTSLFDIPTFWGDKK